MQPEYNKACPMLHHRALVFNLIDHPLLLDDLFQESGSVGLWVVWHLQL
jgi:hypothetical protein